jgi:hypothetical protein
MPALHISGRNLKGVNSDTIPEMLYIPTAIASFLGVALVILSIMYARNHKQAKTILARYSQIIDLEDEKARLSSANLRLREEMMATEQRATDDHRLLLKQHLDDQEAFLLGDQKARATLSAEYQTALAHYQELQKEIAIGEDSLEDLSFGLYKPHFTFQTPDEYKAKIELLRNQQRDVVRKG